MSGYRVYRDVLVDGDVVELRLYWTGPGSVIWTDDPNVVAVFADMPTARAAVAHQWRIEPQLLASLLAETGYEFVPAPVEHLTLFPNPEGAS